MVPGVVAVIVLLVAGATVVRLHGPGADSIHDLGCLPEQFGTCGRTLAFVRVASDGYVAYELSGGP